MTELPNYLTLLRAAAILIPNFDAVLVSALREALSKDDLGTVQGNLIIRDLRPLLTPQHLARPQRWADKVAAVLGNPDSLLDDPAKKAALRVVVKTCQRILKPRLQGLLALCEAANIELPEEYPDVENQRPAGPEIPEEEIRREEKIAEEDRRRARAEGRA